MKFSIKISWAFYLVSVITLIIFAILSAYSTWDNQRSIGAEFERNLRSRTDVFIDSIASSLIMGDYVQTIEASKKFTQKEDVKELRVVLSSGETLFTNTKEILRLKNPNDLVVVDREVSIDADWSSKEKATLVAKLSVVYDISHLKETISNIGIRSLLTLLWFLIFVWTVGFILSRKVSKPLEKLSSLTARGELQEISYIKVNSAIKEIAVLQGSISDMSIKLIKLNKTEQEAAIGRIISQVSHDMRAPLGVFESILDSPPEKVASSYGMIREALYRLNAMIESLRHSNLESIIKKIVTQVNYYGVIEGLQKKARLRNVSIEVNDEGKSKVLVDSSKFERACVNLVSNAIDAANSFVRLSIVEQGSNLVLKVYDDGPGVADEIQSRLFQRGATYGKSDGTGLGLAYVKQIMQGHGGDVVYHRENGLTIFECRLPNAVIEKEDMPLELLMPTKMSLEQLTPKLVSICVEPPVIANEILANLNDRISSKFTFNGKYLQGTTKVVVTNSPEFTARILEEDHEVEIAEYQPTLPQEILMARILRRFEA